MSLYESMAEHPDTGPVMALLDLVEPCDEFSRALCLVRDCFSPSDTLRELSRKQLRGLLEERVRLLGVFESAVMDAARATGCETNTFDHAWNWLTHDARVSLQEAYAAQVRKLMGRE